MMATIESVFMGISLVDIHPLTLIGCEIQSGQSLRNPVPRLRLTRFPSTSFTETGWLPERWNSRMARGWNDFEMRQMVGVPSMQLPASIEIDGGRTEPRFGRLEYGFLGAGEP
jgi:hypothetical protein